MTEPQLRILLVDDLPAGRTDLASALSKIGYDAEIDFRCPDDRENLLQKMPSGREWDGYDLAMVDMELCPEHKNPVSYDSADLRGGSVILPYIRSHAPWLPVLGYSRLIMQDGSTVLLTHAGSFGFDVTTPRFFATNRFSRQMWDEVLWRARAQRSGAVFGYSPARRPTIEVALGLQDELDKRYPQWRDVLQAAFGFASSIVIEDLQSGFSGAKVLRAFTQLAPDDGMGEAEWVVKLSISPSKLQQEANAHCRMMRSGVEHARIVPLLWPQVIVRGRCACLVYQFAKNSYPLSKSESSGLVPAVARIRSSLDGFYRRRSESRHVIGKVVREWCQVSLLSGAAARVAASRDVSRLIEAIVSSSDSGYLSRAEAMSMSLLHGDLHLNNILMDPLGDAVIIDFARSRVGPIAFDVAKFVSDCLLRFSEFRQGDPPSSRSLGGLDAVAKEIVALLQTPGDHAVFDISLVLLLVEALNYPDIDMDTKAWIESVLLRVDLSRFGSEPSGCEPESGAA